MKAINPPAEAVPFKSQAAVKARAEKAKEMAAAGYTSRQIAKEIGISYGSMPDFSKRHGVIVPADQVHKRLRILDSNQILEEAVTTLHATATAVSLAELDQLDAEHLAHWVASLTTSLRSLNRFLKQLKEATQ